MIAFDEAVAIVRSAARPLGTKRVQLDLAAARVLADPVIAEIDSPRAEVSAMDGYAVRDSDLTSFPAKLQVVGESLPGSGWREELKAGTCARIFTGAPLPKGADRIVIQENVVREGVVAHIADNRGTKTWIRPRGGDFRKGDIILPTGTMLDPAALIAAAGADLGTVTVSRRPRVALLSNGDELVEPGEARKAALDVPDSVMPGIAALAEQWGGTVGSRVRLRDDLEFMTAAARQAVDQADVVIVAGGASVGDRDFAKAMFEPLGLELLFSKVSIRPGKPAWFGRAGDAYVLGLPGNPTSALVTARLFLAPLLARLQGRAERDALDWEPARLTVGLPPCDARETFHRVVLRNGDAAPVEFQESHAQLALAQSNALVRQPAGSGEIAAGQVVSTLRL